MVAIYANIEVVKRKQRRIVVEDVMLKIVVVDVVVIR